MGVFRGGLLVIFSVLFFVCLLVQGLFLIFYFSLDYNSVSPQISSIASEVMQQQGIEQQILEKKPIIEVYCKNNSEFIFSNPNIKKPITISCNEFLENPDNLVQTPVSNLIEDKYYSFYDCNFFDCVQKTQDPFSLVSKHAQDYWKIKSLYLLVVLVLLALLLFILVKSKSNFFILSSVFFLISSFFFLKLEFFVGFIINLFLNVGEGFGGLFPLSFLQIFSIFLDKSKMIFVIFLVIGISLFVIGVIMKIFRWSVELSKVIDKFSGWVKKKKDSSFKNKKETEPVVKVQNSKKTAKK